MSTLETKERIHQLQVDSILKEGIHDDLLHHRLKLAVDQDCPLCLKREDGQVGKLRIMHGRFGVFLSCDRYPTCRFAWNDHTLIENELDKLNKD